MCLSDLSAAAATRAGAARARPVPRLRDAIPGRRPRARPAGRRARSAPRRRPRGRGSKVGVVALAGLTLLECGESTGDKAVLKTVETVRHEASGLRFTYSLALCILFLDRWYDSKERTPEPRDRELIQRLATQMI